MNLKDLPPLPPEPPVPPTGQQPAPAPTQFLGYDAQGQPLYGTQAHPAQQQPTTPATPAQPEPTPQVVHISRAIAPEAQTISPKVKARHDESMRHYPWLNLSDGEFIISAVRRHLIGLLLPVGIGIFLIGLVLSIIINYPYIMTSLNVIEPPDVAIVAIIGLLFCSLVAIGMYIAVWVYRSNRFFLTNESVIQEIQMTLFSKKEQTVSLANIEDASFDQHGFIQHMFDYGSIRLSTEGDETTYRFNYVANPKDHISQLNNAVEAFKNGRPVSED